MRTSTDIEDFMKKIEEWSFLSKDWNTPPRILNKLHDEYHKMFKAIRAKNRLKELMPFLNHSDKAVRNVIATYYLVQDEKTAVKILEELSKEDGLIGMGSRSNLEEWRKGNLHFDY